jgi:hypothetical protein
LNHRNEIIKLFSLNLIYNAIQSKEIFYHKILNSNLLQKIIIDDVNYTIVNKDNGDKLLKKITNINITDIKDIKTYDFKKSIILECLIDNKNLNKLKYRPILEQIYKYINDGTTIIKNTKLNIKTIKKEDEGYYYLDNLGISIQGVDSNKCLLEIINQCLENRIKLSMKIKMLDGIIIDIEV